MATTRKKVSAKKAATKKTPVKKTAKKAAVKAPAKKAVPKKAAAKKSAVKKTAAKKVVKKAAPKKTVAKAAPSKAAVKVAAKKVVKKAAAKKAAVKKPKAEAAVKKPVAAPKVSEAKAPVAAPAAQAPEVKQAIKGLKVGGALGARIAQIVAESARQKPASPAPLAEIEDVPQRGEETAALDVSRPIASSKDEPGPVEVAHKAAALLFAKKAEDVVLLDLRNLSTVADYYLICTCHNEPQMRAMLNDVQRTLSREGIKSLRSEYMSGVRWAIIDYGDLIIHLFEAQTRGFYSLERLWADAPSTRLKPEDYALAAESDADEDDDL